MPNAGIEAIKEMRRKKAQAKKELVQADQSVAQDQRVEINVLHDDSVFRANLLNHLFVISQTLAKLEKLLSGEESED